MTRYYNNYHCFIQVVFIKLGGVIPEILANSSCENEINLVTLDSIYNSNQFFLNTMFDVVILNKKPINIA